MPIAVKPISGGDELQGHPVIRGFRVEGLSPGSAVLLLARVAVDSDDPSVRIPRHGEPHPDPRYTGYTVARIEVRPVADDDGAAIVAAAYERHPQAPSEN